jgi:AraC-like DNA-binding protein
MTQRPPQRSPRQPHVAVPVHLPDTPMSEGDAAAYLAMGREQSLRNYLVRRSACRYHGRRAMRPNEMDALFHYLLGARDLADVFGRMRSFYFMLKERLGEGIFLFREEQQSTIISINYAWQVKERSLEEATLLSLEPIFYFLQWAIDQEIEFQEISVPWQHDANTIKMMANISQTITFDAEKILIRIHSELLSRPVVRKLHELTRFYALLPCFSVIGFRKSDNQQDYFKKIIIRYFETHKHMPTLTDMANMFAQSTASLKRTLQANGLSFRALTNECKRECACRLLGDKSISIKEVAFRLGYNDHNAFRRAFREWSGTQPSKWRFDAAAVSDIAKVVG